VTFSILETAGDALAPRHDDLDLALAQIRAADLDHPDSEAARKRIQAFCAKHSDALHRSCLEGHLTGSALVVDPQRKQALLLHHAKLDRWLQPGGHADGDGNLAAVALKEASEETGIPGLRVVSPAIDIDVHHIPARGDEPEHLHLDLRFLVLAPAGAEPAHNHEALGARWVHADDPVVTGSPELRRAVDRALATAALVDHRGPRAGA
jgi:8-oxo-dGTP pyrophosphatase MutT (NUDIX family)